MKIFGTLLASLLIFSASAGACPHHGNRPGNPPERESKLSFSDGALLARIRWEMGPRVGEESVFRID